MSDPSATDARFRLALKAARQGAWEYDLRTNAGYRSPELRDLLGVQNGSPSLADYLSNVHADDRPRILEAFTQLRSGQIDESVVQYRFIRDDGRPIWVEQHTLVERDDHGEAIRLYGLSRDITARKQAEHALQDLNATLEARVQERTQQLEEERAAQAAFVAFTEAVGTDTDLHALATRAVEVLRAQFPNCTGGYYELDQHRWTLRVWSEDLNASPDLLAILRAGLPQDTPSFARVARTAEPVFFEEWDAAAEQIEQSGQFASAAAYPLLHDGRVQATLSIGLRDTPRWSDRDRAVFRAVGRSLSLAVERAEQTARLARRNAELAARTRALEGFAALTRDLGAQRDAHALVQRAQDVALSMLPEGYAVYYELDGDTWRLRAQTGDLRNPELQAVVDAGLPYAATRNLVLPWTTRQAHYQDAYDKSTDDLTALVQHVSTTATLPVLVNGVPVGVFGVALFSAHRWTAIDRAILETVVRSLGQALERAQSVAELALRSQELERSNRELQRERSFLRAVLESLAEGVVACAPDGQLTLFNDAARTMHGLDASTLPPEAWPAHYKLFEADGATPLTTDRIPLVRAWQGERVRDAEIVIRPDDGPARSLVANGQPIFTEDGEPLGAVVAMHDLTERKVAEEAVRRSNEELRRSNQELEQFAYIASHDLQAPLRAMTSFADLIARKYADRLDARGQVYLGQIAQSGKHMKRLVDDLLAFSRVTTEERTVQPTDSGAVLDGVLERMRVEMDAAGGQVDRAALPTVLIGAGQLDQLFQNLVGNALKYHRPGVPPRVRVRAAPDGPLWHFTVQDNGIGIEPAYFERVFEIFQRLHTREQYEGTGVGLAICKKIVERHGGQLWLDSTPGEGSTFHFTLPGA
ncbi:ATP-binding protein [Deinococcus maricopensis]|nr:ATP-binding protein [Deinococcus maricopensis]